MGACNSTRTDKFGESPSRKVTFSGTHSDSFYKSSVESHDLAGCHTDTQLCRVPTVNRVIVTKSALADSSDEEKSEENDSEESVEETNESSKYSASSDMHLEEDEKRETPFQFDWMKDLPRSPAESKRKKLNDAAAAKAREKLAEEQEDLERKMLEEEERLANGGQGEERSSQLGRRVLLKICWTTSRPQQTNFYLSTFRN